jgi:hypothetical protein
MKRNRRQRVSPLLDPKNLEFQQKREKMQEGYAKYLRELFEMFDALPRSFRESFHNSPVSVDELIDKAAEAFFSRGWSEQMILAELERFKQMHLKQTEEAQKQWLNSTTPSGSASAGSPARSISLEPSPGKSGPQSPSRSS